jgi:hypothetical protein
MALLGGADEFVVRALEPLDHGLKRGTLRSTSCCGVSFSLAAVCSIFMPCSSVPVRKSTS